MIRRGFGFIFSIYGKNFRAGQKNQKAKAEQYLEGIFYAERGNRNIKHMVEAQIRPTGNHLRTICKIAPQKEI